ncbi:hypothetical protein RD136_004581 [Salmonella enterica]|nr:hypothetical protein [Salmonella enterica]
MTLIHKVRAAAAVVALSASGWVAANETAPAAYEATTMVVLAYRYVNATLHAPDMRFIPNLYNDDDIGRIEIESTKNYLGLELCLWSDNVNPKGADGMVFLVNALGITRPTTARWESGGTVGIGKTSETAKCNSVHGRGTIVLVDAQKREPWPGEYTATIHGRYKVP